MAKINVAALDSIKTDAQSEVFNQTTFGLDLRIKGFEKDGFEQIGNGFSLVYRDGVVAIGKVEALADPETKAKGKLIGVKELGYDSFESRKQMVSGFSRLVRYGAEGFEVGFHPAGKGDREFGVVGYARNNYKGMDLQIPQDGNWHEVVTRPMPGQGSKSYCSNKELFWKAQIQHDAIDYALDGYVITMYWPQGFTDNGENMLDWLLVVLGHNQAILDGDEKLVAIYETRYNEGKMNGQLQEAARKVMAPLSKDERQETASQAVVMMTQDGREITLSDLSDGSLVRFVNSTGIHKGQQVWYNNNPYVAERFRQAAQRGLLAEVVFDSGNFR